MMIAKVATNRKIAIWVSPCASADCAKKIRIAEVIAVKITFARYANRLVINTL